MLILKKMSTNSKKAANPFLMAVILFFLLAHVFILPPDLFAARMSEAQGSDETVSDTGETGKVNPPANGEEKVTIDFQDVDIRVVAMFISKLTGRNFIFDRQFQGQVTVYSPEKVTKKEAYQLFESVLEVNGFTTVPTGKYIKIIPSLKAKTKAIETRRTEKGDSRDRVITQLIHLKHADAQVVSKLLMPLMDKTGVMMSYNQGNIIIITDYSSNINRLLKIVRSIDVEGEGSGLHLIPLVNASARELARELEQLIRTRNKPQTGQTFSIVADERTNTLVIMARPSQIQEIESLVEQLDAAAPRGADKVHVYFLENAQSEALAQTLSQLTGGVTGAQASAQATAAQRRVLLQNPVIIVADKSTNSLVIRAESQDYQVLKEIIEKLDQQRAQVLVEGLIMETTFKKSLTLGAEWRALGSSALSPNSTQYTPFAATNLPNSGSSNGLINQMSTNPLAGPAGLVLGAAKGTLSFGGVTFMNIGMMIQALQTDSEVNILSTPHILTMDNEEASIVVGEERPFLKTSQTQETGGTIRTFEYRDLGITLKITPQVSQGNFIKLNVYLQIKNFVAEAETGAVTSTKREATTTVIVADGETVVIGGFIRDNTSAIESAVPCLGQIPVAGMLFRSRNKRDDKTNLLILLSPTIVRTPEKLKTLTKEKKDASEKAQQDYEQGKKRELEKNLKYILE